MINCKNILLDTEYSYIDEVTYDPCNIDNEIKEYVKEISNNHFRIIYGTRSTGSCTTCVYKKIIENADVDVLYIKNMAYILYLNHSLNVIRRASARKWNVTINSKNDTCDYLLETAHLIKMGYVITDVNFVTASSPVGTVTFELLCSDDEEYVNLFKLEDKFEEFMEVLHQHFYANNIILNTKEKGE